MDPILGLYCVYTRECPRSLQAETCDGSWTHMHTTSISVIRVCAVYSVSPRGGSPWPAEPNQPRKAPGQPAPTSAQPWPFAFPPHMSRLSLPTPGNHECGLHSHTVPMFWFWAPLQGGGDHSGVTQHKADTDTLKHGQGLGCRERILPRQDFMHLERAMAWDT